MVHVDQFTILVQLVSYLLDLVFQFLPCFLLFLQLLRYVASLL